MPVCICVYRPDHLMAELTIDLKYRVLNMRKNEVLINNNLSIVKWYPLSYFKFV